MGMDSKLSRKEQWGWRTKKELVAASISCLCWKINHDYDKKEKILKLTRATETPAFQRGPHTSASMLFLPVK